MVQNVKSFDAELNVELFRNLTNPIVLEYREVESRQTRAPEDIAACVAKPVAGIGKQEALGSNVINRISGVDERVATRSSKSVGIVKDNRVVHTQRISTY